MNTVTTQISFIIPAFNHVKYIEHCLNSISNNNIFPSEILIADDGSTDGTIEKIEQWIELNSDMFTRIRFHKCSRQGITKNLNLLFKEAQGEFALLTASDDYFTDEAVSARIDLFQNTEIEAVIGDAIIVDGENQITHPSSFRKWQHDIEYLKTLQGLKNSTVLNWSIPGPCLMIRRQTYLDLGGYDENLLVEDRDFYLRLIARGKTIYLDQPVAHYRVHNTNVTRTASYTKIITHDLLYTNSKNAHLYSGFLYLFLMTYKIDYFFFKKNIQWKWIYFLLRQLRTLIRAVNRNHAQKSN